MRGDLLDLILIGLVIAFGVSGYRQGFIIGVMSFVGFVGGAVLGVFIAPPISKAVVDGDTPQALLAIVIVFLSATIGQFASSTIGAVVRSHVTWEPAKVADAVGGTFASALSVLVIAWLIGSLVVSTSFSLLVEQVKSSMLLTTVDEAIPQAARNWQQPFKKFIDRSEFPPVFDAIGAGQIIDVPPAPRSILKGAGLGRAQRAIVKVQGNAESCNKHIEGTGFVYARDRIMTNAHVVAGVTRDLTVIDSENRRRPATVVRYNPQRDIAILYVPGLGLPQLPFEGEADKGDNAIIAGFPKGQGFTAEPARIRSRLEAEGPDIYRAKNVTRQVYAIRGKVLPGNSGGPLLTVDGKVYGVIFAAAVSQQDTGYVLTAAEVRPDADQGRDDTTPAGTQECD
ncbi:MarP family serine protease [Nonomuraea roseoviolacea subsp. roseoviolacea]|uniref:S1-C subfamily serine protease n=1 Tax=Nonomuraea roseoviolacea subsp. carminata TaxID=160689 RepID=A0ABT1JYU8_9ACTN|nr:MarP family serine protease [Nonomuraea roseoviolacea]MCP2346905.1 S1-C subfamily serine protease [Nonomuraea roseoviolacea subsp. carminata]